jgi:hypothetical protein
MVSSIMPNFKESKVDLGTTKVEQLCLQKQSGWCHSCATNLPLLARLARGICTNEIDRLASARGAKCAVRSRCSVPIAQRVHKMEEGPEPQELMEEVEHRKEEAEERGHEGAPKVVAHRTRCAITASILAVAAAIGSLLSGHAANEAILKQSAATDRWAYFQSVSTKGHMYEASKSVVEALAPKDQAGSERVAAAIAAMDKAANKYEKLKDGIQAEAQKLSDESDKRFEEHQKVSYGVACFQIGIVLASVSILVSGEWLFFGSLGLGVIGLVFVVLALV